MLQGKQPLDLGMLHALGSFANLQQPIASAPKEESEQDDGKKRKRKYNVKPKDPNAPKRPLTAYFLFLQDVRPEITAEMGDGPHKPGDISQEATRRWKEMSEEAKQV